MIAIIDDFLDDMDEGVLYMPEFADCLVGSVWRCGSKEVLCYDAEQIVETLVKRDGLTHEDALEHFNFNVSGGYVGEYTPMFLRRLQHPP